MPAVALLLAIGWSVRFVGIHESLRARGLSVRDEWAYHDDWVREQPRPMPLTSEEGQNPNQPQHVRPIEIAAAFRMCGAY